MTRLMLARLSRDVPSPTACGLKLTSLFFTPPMMMPLPSTRRMLPMMAPLMEARTIST